MRSSILHEISKWDSSSSPFLSTKLHSPPSSGRPRLQSSSNRDGSAPNWHSGRHGRQNIPRSTKTPTPTTYARSVGWDDGATWKDAKQSAEAFYKIAESIPNPPLHFVVGKDAIEATRKNNCCSDRGYRPPTKCVLRAWRNECSPVSDNGLHGPG
ncbi:hypothetical protein LXA43DRAFT_538159 [Ganoderma leucocontextum]|nr:hypothetical protein LXA43DRAFT_538159 [Ganoderma leucocontextum]